MSDSTFSGNSAYAGGAISNGSTATVSDSTFSGNSDSSGGGGAIDNGGTLTVSDSTLSGNSDTGGLSGVGGGAIENGGGTLTVSNSTLSGNSAPHGGAIYQQSGTVTVTNTLIANNSCGGDITDGGYNLEWQGAGGTLTCGFGTSNHDQVGVDPGLAAGLANNGGPTQTLAVSSSGAAYFNGNGTVCQATGPGSVNGVDQRGEPRPLPAPAPSAPTSRSLLPILPAPTPRCRLT